MRGKLIVATVALAVAAATSGGVAWADGEFSVSPSSGQVQVTANSPWHINPDFPWKLTQGSTKLDKSKFSFSDSTATVSGAASGTWHLKGAVCTHDDDNRQCKVVEADVTLP